VAAEVGRIARRIVTLPGVGPAGKSRPGRTGLLYTSTSLDGKTIDVLGVVIAPARPAGTWANRIVVRDGSRVHIIPAEKLDAAQA
jgi:hypothetical protein